MAVDTNPFPEVSSNMVIPDLSKLSKPRQKTDMGQSSNPQKEPLGENKYGGAPARNIYDLKKIQAEKKGESVLQTDLPTRVDLSAKTTDELLDEIREQQIELIKRGLCPKCKAVTRPEKSTPNKRPRLPPRPPSPPRRPIQNRLVYPSKEPARAVKVERQN